MSMVDDYIGKVVRLVNDVVDKGTGESAKKGQLAGIISTSDTYNSSFKIRLDDNRIIDIHHENIKDLDDEYLKWIP